VEKLANSIATKIYTFVSKKSLGKMFIVTYITIKSPLDIGKERMGEYCI